MAKTNSLKIAPYTKQVHKHYEYDEPIRPRDYYAGGWDTYRASAREVIDFDGETLMEYTRGKPGEQGSSYGYDSSAIDWRPNDPFQATLRIVRLERGRSAARFWFVDDVNKIEYPFFGQTLVDMLSNATMVNGVVTGTWIVVKKGSNYGIELYQP